MSDVYQKLAKHLDNLPGGFPATESGVELRILKRLFTTQEARIAMGLSMTAQPASAIAAGMDFDESSMAQILESMAQKGLIFHLKKNNQDLYMAAQFVIGIWEYHVNDLDEDLIKDFNAYLPHFMKNAWMKHKTKQLRVIPIAKSIPAEMNIMPYDQAEKIIQQQSKIVVAPCICRKEHTMMGHGCGKLSEACLIFGHGAYFYEKNSLGRSISQEKALEILEKASESGLVLQPGNAQKPSNICLCCGCCCQILNNLKALEQPAKAVCTNYFAVINEENCTACGICVDRCQMDAVIIQDVARIDAQRCIGCGLCVAGCDAGAIDLKEKTDADRWVPPTNTYKTFLKIARERGLL